MKRFSLAALDKDAVGQVDEIVAGSTAHRPFRRQIFARLQYLLDHGVERPLALRPVVSAHRIEYAALDSVGGGFLMRLPAGALAGEAQELQPDQVLAGVKHAIAMVDAESGHCVRSNQPSNQAVRCREDLRIFHAQPDQVIHVKEAAVVDFFGGGAPGGQAIRLCIQQTMEPVETAGVSLDPVDGLERMLDDGLHFL